MGLTFPAQDQAAHQLERDGFLVLRLSEPLHAAIDAAREAARRFFDLGAETRALNTLPFGCGYWGHGAEHSGDASQPDRVNFFGASPRTERHAHDLPTQEARQFHERLLSVFGFYEAIAEDITTAAARLSGLDRTERLRGGLRRWSMIQISQTVATAAGAPIYLEHEDGHLLSFAQADSPGLEIRTHEGLTPAPSSSDSVLVMPGELMRLLSGGRFRPLYHRVRSVPQKKPRLALLFFADLDPAKCFSWGNRLATQDECAAHVLSNASRFGMPGFSPEDEVAQTEPDEGLFPSAPMQYPRRRNRADNSGL